MECKRKVKCVIKENKKKVDDNFGRNSSKMYKRDHKAMLEGSTTAERKKTEQWRG